MTREEMVEMFICPGCVGGSDTKCGQYWNQGNLDGHCENHVLGTLLSGIGNIATGLPKGFNRPGWSRMNNRSNNKMLIRCYTKYDHDNLFYNELNVPVWAL